jgi:hypothetical protein
MAWVNVSAPNDGFRTFLSQDGNQISGFYLQKGSDGHFIFSIHASDGTQTSVAIAESTVVVQPSTWYHVAGVYDGTAGTISLYVNGALQGPPVRFTSPWGASGPLAVGRAMWGGQGADWFSGLVKDVRVYRSALPAAAVAAVVGTCVPQTAAAACGWDRCGEAADGCGNMVSCGVCGANFTCGIAPGSPVHQRLCLACNPMVAGSCQ